MLEIPTYLGQPAVFSQFSRHTRESYFGLVAHGLVDSIRRDDRISIEGGEDKSRACGFTLI